MTREYDPIAEALIQQAATDAYDLLTGFNSASAVTKFVRCGKDVFRLRLTIVVDEQKVEGAERARKTIETCEEQP